jgi:glycosyltransferase involved in cell wall biosynthesis
VDELVGAIQKLVEDPALRRRMGQAGRARVVQHFAVERIVEQYLELYTKVLYVEQNDPRHRRRWFHR